MGLLPLRYVKLRVAHAPGMFSPPPRIRNPDMHHGTCVTHEPWCMPGSLTSGLLRSRGRGKRSRHMRNPQFYVSDKRPVALSTLPSLYEGVQTANNTALMWFWLEAWQAFEQRVGLTVIWDAMTLMRRHCNSMTFEIGHCLNFEKYLCWVVRTKNWSYSTVSHATSKLGNGLFIQHLVQANKRNMKAPHYWPLWGESKLKRGSNG